MPEAIFIVIHLDSVMNDFRWIYQRQTIRRVINDAANGETYTQYTRYIKRGINRNYFFLSNVRMPKNRTRRNSNSTMTTGLRSKRNKLYARKYICTYNSCRPNVVAIHLAVDAIERGISIYYVVNVINVAAYTINRIQSVYMPPKSK